MRIRLFNTYEPVSSFFRDIVPMLAEAGIETEIVMSAAEYRAGRSLESVLGHIPSVTVIKTVNLGLHAHQGFWAKGIVTALYTLQATLYGLFGPSTDINLFLSQPPLVPLLGLLFAKVRRQPYYCVVMDVQPQMTVALGLTRGDSLLTKLFGQLSLLGLRHAKGVIAIGRCMQEFLSNWGVPAARIHYIPNWVNEEEIQPVPLTPNILRQEMGWGDDFVVMYAGNLGLPQYFDDLLAVAEELQQKASSDPIRLVFIGTGAKEAYLRSEVARRKLDTVEIYPFLHTRYSLSDILGAANVHFVTLRDSCTGLAVPSKTYGVLAAGRPVLYQGGEEGEIARMLREAEIGVWVRPGDSAGLREAILQYQQSPALAISHGQNARTLTETTYSRKRSLASYLSILTREQSNRGRT